MIAFMPIRANAAFFFLGQILSCCKVAFANLRVGRSVLNADSALETQSVLSHHEEAFSLEDATQKALILLRKDWKQKLAGRTLNSRIPCTIHQTWKSTDLDEEEQASIDSWKELNPQCKHNLWSDEDVAMFVKKHYKESIWPLWQHLTPVQRADSFRYMVILLQGGYYADIDVFCTTPIEEWNVPLNVSLIAGYEQTKELTTEEVMQHKFIDKEQVEQWFFAAKPGHEVVERCLENVVSNFHFGERDTLRLTGPAPWTDSVRMFYTSKGSLRKVKGNFDIPLHQVIGPQNAQAWMLTAYEAGAAVESDGNQRLVDHHYKGSWKPRPKKKDARETPESATESSEGQDVARVVSTSFFFGRSEDIYWYQTTES